MNFSGISDQKVIGKPMRLPLKLVPPGLRVPILQGRLKGKTWVVGAATHGCWLGSYEYDKQQAFESTIPAGSVVFDIGANVGFYTLLAAVLVGPEGKVVSFEPLPRNIRFLKRHARLNDLSNVIIIEAAVDESDGEAFFNTNQGNLAGQLDEKGNLRVETVSLDELIEQKRVPTPDYLKIDVEGAEGRVLLGAQNLLFNRKPTIFLALHNAEANLQCRALLEAAGYELRALDGKALQESDEIIAQPKKA